MATFYSASQLSAHIPYDARYINNVIRDKYFIEGKHYVRPFGGRKILYIWEIIKKDILENKFDECLIPLSSGGYING